MGDVPLTRAPVCESMDLDTLTVDSNVDRQGTPRNVKRWRFPYWKLIIITGQFKKLKSQKHENASPRNFTYVFRICDSLCLLVVYLIPQSS